MPLGFCNDILPLRSTVVVVAGSILTSHAAIMRRRATAPDFPPEPLVRVTLVESREPIVAAAEFTAIAGPKELLRRPPQRMGRLRG
jgi:hypothetical protein